MEFTHQLRLFGAAYLLQILVSIYKTTWGTTFLV